MVVSFVTMLQLSIIMCKVIWFIKERSNTVVFDCYTVLIQGLAHIITRFLKNESEYLKIINLLNIFTIYWFFQ